MLGAESLGWTTDMQTSAIQRLYLGKSANKIDANRHPMDAFAALDKDWMQKALKDIKVRIHTARYVAVLPETVAIAMIGKYSGAPEQPAVMGMFSLDCDDIMMLGQALNDLSKGTKDVPAFVANVEAFLKEANG
jgi:hypothetical protein